MSVVNAGLAWGVPVRPDLFGEHLEAYMESLPKLNALRLCHRFGNGPNVHITKLPAELLIAIEDMIFEHSRSQYTGPWTGLFRHYEGRCEPVDHFLEGYYDVYGEVKEECIENLCERCQAGADDLCTEDCEKAVREVMNNSLMEGLDWRFEDCEMQRSNWEAMISQKPNGQFVKYDKVCLAIEVAGD